MGWGKRESADQGSRRSIGESEIAAAAWFGQLPSLGLILWIVSTVTRNDYGVGIGGGPAAVGFLCMLVLSPPVFWVLGWSLAAVHTMPLLALGDLAQGRVRGPAWLRWAAAVPAVGLGWAILPTALGWCSYVTSALICTGIGVLPLLGVLHGRRRERRTGTELGRGKLWLRSVLGGAGLAVVTVGALVLASVTGILREYEPPKLTEAQLVGVWRGDGAELRLTADRKAEFSGLPYRYVWERDVVERCDGTGVWRPGESGGEAHPEQGVEVEAASCGDGQIWTVGGTAEHPELYVPFGDLDSPDLRILRRR
ncbi:hypothetical protein AB0J38_24395 [Streptomyces sp. NPDC050095]|uniref:hypothetical protein n=1 Tax=unclassified Streptomyces TaxID=2593676 RepID=UPI0034352DEB